MSGLGPAATLSAPQARMVDELIRQSDREEKRHPGSGGWVEGWNVFDAWGWNILPFFLLPATASRVFLVIERAGMVEEHPDHRGLFRPSATARAAFRGEAR